MADLQTLLSYFLNDLLVGFIGTTSSTGFLSKDGTVGAPGQAFQQEPTTGLSRPSAASPTFSVLGAAQIVYSTNLLRAGSGLALGWSSNADPTVAASDTKLTRANAGVLALAHGTATSTAELQVSGGSGGFISSVKALTELTTIAAAATTTTAIQIPANAVVLAVSVRVVTVIPTAATFTVTSATPAKTWNTVAVAVAAGTTDPGTAPGPTFQTTASPITITPNLTPATATGQVRVTIYFYTVTPATS